MITVTLGRQFHVATERVVQAFDVYNLGGSNAHAAPLGLIGVNRLAGNDNRADNSIKLRVRGPLGLTTGLSVAAGEGSGSRSYSAEASQITPDYAVGAFFTRYEAPTLVAATGARPEQQVWGVGAQAPVGPVRLYLTRIDNRLDSTVAGRETQHNQIATAGVSWQASAQTPVKASYTHDGASRLNGLAGCDGKKTPWVAAAEYALAKRTLLYAAACKSDFSGGYRPKPVNFAALGRDLAASSTQPLSTGMRHVF
jgi:predicted porin